MDVQEWRGWTDDTWVIRQGRSHVNEDEIQRCDKLMLERCIDKINNRLIIAKCFAFTYDHSYTVKLSNKSCTGVTCD